MSKPLRRTRNDLIVTAAIAVLAIAGVSTVWATAPIRGSELSPANEPFIATPMLTEIPSTLTEQWRAVDTSPGNHHPSVTAGVIVAADGNSISGYTPTGEQLWSYSRDVDLCALSTSFEAAVATYRTGVGCGDVVSISANDGQYKATRSAIASDEISPLVSNDRVGIVGKERVELWRSDMVRTVEYGEVDAQQEAEQQPNPQCSITSAMTRKDLLAITETCPDGTSFLRMQDTTPEDSREPEISQNIEIADGRIVAIGQNTAAVYVNEPAPTIVSYDENGNKVGEQLVEPADFPDAPSSPATADLPHHMSWFDGNRLILFSPSNLTVGHSFDDALGTGVAIDDKLLYPTPEGIAVANWDSGEVLYTIPIDRSGYNGEVGLSVAGEAIVEKRGNEIVALT